MAQYLAVIGDLIGSRGIAGRRGVQQRIEQVFDDINREYRDLIASRLTLTLGDEFQLIARPDGGVLQLLDELERRLELPFRVGIGYGGLLTDIHYERSIGADGEAFWHARDAIEKVHDYNWHGRQRTCVQGYGTLEDELLNALFAASDALRAGWTALQRETFHRMLEEGIYEAQFDQRSFAATLGITESALSRRLSAGNIKIYLNSRAAIARSLEAWHAAHL